MFRESSLQYSPSPRFAYSGSQGYGGVGRGCEVGRGLGVTLGVAVGVAVGVTLGVAVGVALGVAVGVAVGVGVTVGVAVGVGVGVGDAGAAAKPDNCGIPVLNKSVLVPVTGSIE